MIPNLCSHGLSHVELPGWPRCHLGDLKRQLCRGLASAIAVSWCGRPETGTLEGQGYDVAVKSYAGLGEPAETPEDAIETLQKASAEALDSEDAQRSLKELGTEPVCGTSVQRDSLVLDNYEGRGPARGPDNEEAVVAYAPAFPPARAAFGPRISACLECGVGGDSAGRLRPAPPFSPRTAVGDRLGHPRRRAEAAVSRPRKGALSLERSTNDPASA